VLVGEIEGVVHAEKIGAGPGRRRVSGQCEPLHFRRLGRRVPLERAMGRGVAWARGPGSRVENVCTPPRLARALLFRLSPPLH
jgi:hypothetical protein